MLTLSLKFGMESGLPTGSIMKYNFLLTLFLLVKLAWREVKSSTIVKCFKHAEILNDCLNVHALSEEDPFQDIDETIAIGSLISTTMGTRCDTCSAEEYVNGDNDLAVAMC